MPAPPEPIEDIDAFHNSFRAYLDAVEMLAAEPEDQCSMMGDYNVAWELKDDVQAGCYLLGRGHLSASEERAISSLVSALNEVDTQVLPAGAGREVNVRAMSHPSWIPSRHLAAEVLRELQGASARAASFFRNGTGAA